MELTLDQALQRAVDAHKAGQAQEADRLYTAILQAQPKHPDANHNMGVLAVGVGKIQEALPFFKAALEANQSAAQFWLSYIHALIKLDRLADAKNTLEQAKAKGVKGNAFDKLEQSLNASNNTLCETGSGGNGEEQDPSNILDTLTLDQATKLAKKKSKGGAFEDAKRIYQDILTRFPKNKKANDGMKSLSGRPIGKKSKAQDPLPDQLNTLINLYTQGQLQQVLNQATPMLKQFPASPTLCNILGVANAGLGNFGAAIDSYKQALKIKPDYAEAYYNMGGVLKDKGDSKAAIDSYQQALKTKPDYAEAYYNIGIVLTDKGDLEAAIDSYKQALKIKPDYAEAHINMGIVLKGKGNLEAAIDSYKQALKIKPDSAEAYNNIGNSLRKKGDLEAAIDSYKQALKIKPDFAEVYNNIGNALKEKGDLETAIDNYKQALKIKPDFAEAYCNYESILVQDIASYGLTMEQGALNNEKQKALIFEQPKYQVLRSIFNYISGDFNATEESLSQYFRLCASGETESLQWEDQVFCSTYATFLRKLIERKPLTSNSNQTKIYHVGESHCLSYAHCSLNIGKQPSKISSAITIGAKAYHFANAEENVFKAITKRNLNAIPKASIVFVSIGEIDCRADEGLLQAAEKTGLKLEELVKKTVAGYISWFENANQGNKHKLHFLNVPAPALNERVANVVTLFNEALENEIRGSNSFLIDVYEHTKNTEGFSNTLYHCDGIHLDNRILSVIEDQLNQ